MTYSFERDQRSGLILVKILLNAKYKLKMALDTGASNTTFDINPLYMADYPIGDLIETGMVETASGFMKVNIIQTDVISAFGHSVRGMKVQIYDFLAHGIISNYDGVLGLDFFKNTVFTIDMEEQTIEVKSKKK